MIKHFCDRCGQEISGEVYYITITSDSLTSLNGYDYKQTLASASCNVLAHLSIPKSYCKSCKEEIEEILKTSKKGTWQREFDDKSVCICPGCGEHYKETRFTMPPKYCPYCGSRNEETK